MNRFIIDANVLFSAIIGGRRIYFELIRNFDLYAPDYVFKEIEKYEERLIKKTKLSKKDLNQFLLKLFKGITVLPSVMIDKESKEKALELCRDIDEKDTPYIALALELGIPVITNDKKLYKGLRGKSFEKILLVEELFRKNENNTV